MLVYLDTSHFWMLERLRTRDPDRFDRFIANWISREHILALSLNHAQEIAQLSDESSRQRRLNVIEQFPGDLLLFSERGSADLLEIEIIVQIEELLGNKRKSFREIQKSLFTKTFQHFAQKSVQSVEEFKQGFSFRKLVAQETNDLARNSTSKKKAPATNVHQIIDNKELRSELEKLLGISSMEVTPKLHLLDFGGASYFFLRAREIIMQRSHLFGIPPEHLLSITPKLDPYRLPGYSLGMAISRARQMSGIQTNASDYIDDSHICFAPYVDILLVDKRTLAYLNQEVHHRPELQVTPPDGRVRTAGRIDQIEQALKI